MLYLSDFVRKEIDQGKWCGLVMLDLQKAFDTVDHNILLCKLKAIGFDSLSLDWMRSYLSHREQSVDVNGTLSDIREINCGVPMGSVLGPLLFLLYINDMSEACNCKLFLYADDSALLVSHPDKAVVEDQLSSELENICVWLADNKLSIHLGKTEAILFGSKFKIRNSPDFNVTVQGTAITAKSSVKYLGCLFDNVMSGEDMALQVIEKVNAKAKFLARKSKFLDFSKMKT